MGPSIGDKKMNWKHIVLIWTLTTVSHLGAGALIWWIMQAPVQIRSELVMPKPEFKVNVAAPIVKNKIEIPAPVIKNNIKVPAPTIKENITEIVKNVYLLVGKKLDPKTGEPVSDEYGEKLPAPKDQ